MVSSLTNQQIYGLIALIVYAFLKSIAHFIKIINPFNFNTRQLEIYKKLELLVSDVCNIIFILLSLYLIFIKNINSFNYFIICMLLLFKGILHFITDYDLYKFFNFDKKSQDKIENFHDKFSNISDLLIGLISFYLLVRIFIG